MVLYINMLGSRLTFSIFCKNNTGFIVSVKYAGIYKVWNPQFVEELPDPHIFIYCVLQGNVLSFCVKNRDSALFFAAPGD